MNDELRNCPFPRDEEEAEKYFKNYEHFDPFPWIPPALLNSADIYSYARVTGMVFPFDGNPTKNKLKSASYEIDFLGEVYYWNDSDRQYYLNIEIKKDDPFTIPKNSIVFISPKTIFHLPDYIALRFNLRIKHVHRGLLLGTGPLVDPGFEGRLFIPLHNLTSEDYIITGGEGLIWVEFTKLSPHNHWINDRTEYEGYNHFPVESRNRIPQKYLNASSSGKPVRSSIPGEVKNVGDIAQKASDQIHKFYEEFRKWTTFFTLAITISIVSLAYTTWNLFSNAYQHIEKTGSKVESFDKEQVQLNQKIKNLEEKIKSLTELVKNTKK